MLRKIDQKLKQEHLDEVEQEELLKDFKEENLEKNKLYEVKPLIN